MSTEDDTLLPTSIFQEPEGYFQPEKPATLAEHTLLSGQVFRLRLVGSHPLWGHFLWNAAQVLSEYIQRNADELARGKDVLEFGAGAGLPSFVTAMLGARKVVITDYPDQDLLENLKYNISTTQSLLPSPKPSMAVEGYLWGASTSHLLSHVSSQNSENTTFTPVATGFDTLILADLIFNHTEHAKLLQTVQSTLRRSAEARALVFFSPHRPWLLHKDLAFFELAREGGFEVQKMVERVMEKAMFEVDRGDELLRRTVYGYELRWKEDET